MSFYKSSIRALLLAGIASAVVVGPSLASAADEWPGGQSGVQVIIGADLPAPVRLPGKKRAWTYDDSQELRYVFKTITSMTAADGTKSNVPQAIVQSPDGKYFLALTTNGGDIKTDVGIAEIHIFRTSEVSEWMEGKRSTIQPAFLLRLRMAATWSRLAFYELPRWSPDSRFLIFRGEDGNKFRWAGQFDYFRFDITSGVLEKLVSPSNLDPLSPRENVHNLRRVFAEGDGLLYTQRVFDSYPAAKYPIEWPERGSDGTVMPHDIAMIRKNLIPQVVTVRFGKAQSQVINLKGRIASDGEAAWLSPDGAEALVEVERSVGPSTLGSRENSQPSLSFAKVDLRTARVVNLDRLRPAMTGRAAPSQAYWSQDGRRALILNACLDAADKQGAATCGAIEYQRDTGALQPVYSQPGMAGVAGNAKWLDRGRRLRVDWSVEGQGCRRIIHNLEADGISSSDAGACTVEADPDPGVLPGGLKVALSEGANEPPRLVATRNGREKILLDFNPQLAAIDWARVEKVPLPGFDGHRTTAELILPPGDDGKSRLPLVIQAYGPNVGNFEPDGMAYFGIDAAQTLAARGFAVLIMPIYDDDDKWLKNNDDGYDPRDREGPGNAARVDAAIDLLAARGAIDPERVGMTGFSHGGYPVYYTITHPGKHPLAAAIGADNFEGSFVGYLQFAGDDSGTSPAYAMANSSSRSSFWNDRAGWLKNEPLFNMDKVRTPFLQMYYSDALRRPSAAGDMIPAYSAEIGALVLNRRPFDYAYMGYSDHQLNRPREGAAMQKTVGDWMAFWLKGEAPADPALAERWGKIRDDWRRQQAWEAAGHPAGSKPDRSFVAPPAAGQ